MSKHTPGPLMIRPDFRWPDVVTVRTARKAHECEMPRSNPVVEKRDGSVTRWEQEHPDRPFPLYRSWDGGDVPAEHSARILPGDQYVEYFGEAPAFQSGKRYCAACAVASGIARIAKAEGAA